MVRYRADLDGMRAIAVLAVIAFHISRTALPGGYLGVDMFFVLSGFLITAIIWRETSSGTFSILRFYDRRIRRIMPALLALLAATTAVAAVLLLPADLIGYGRSLLATLAFVANIYFWRDTDYFARAAEDKPLLHLWSLGVEEQFYILFPLLLALLVRHAPRRALPVVAALTLASLALQIIAVAAGAGSPAFFLLPTRAWELGFGATLALLPARSRLGDPAATILASLGLGLVAFGLAHPLEPYGRLPAALPVVAGTAMMILAGRDGPTAVNRALGRRPLVMVGLISYSLYLWHWPVIVFGRYYLVRGFSAPEPLVAVLLMAGAATVSWRFVERPFRRRTMPIGFVRISALGGSVALAIAAALLIGSHGLPQRMTPQVATINAAVDTNYRCPVADYLSFGASRACTMNLPTRLPADADMVLLGNSHAQMYAPLWRSILKARGLTGLLVPLNGCLPTVDANVSRDCGVAAHRNLVALLKLKRVRVVVLGLTWSHPADGLVDPAGRALDNRRDKALVAALDTLIATIRRAGKRVVLIGPIAEPGWDIASILSRQRAFDRAVERPLYRPADAFEQRFGAAIGHFERRRDIGFARPDRVQCRDGRCDFLIGGRSLFADSNHVAAAELPLFRAEFDKALSHGLSGISPSAPDTSAG